MEGHVWGSPKLNIRILLTKIACTSSVTWPCTRALDRNEFKPLSPNPSISDFPVAQGRSSFPQSHKTLRIPKRMLLYTPGHHHWVDCGGWMSVEDSAPFFRLRRSLQKARRWSHLASWLTRRRTVSQIAKAPIIAIYDPRSQSQNGPGPGWRAVSTMTSTATTTLLSHS